ncbi:hypothetical protein P154DRAFT_531405 [Amniculicola lignicola CBS 123094]|uniref:Uncharacterized protein n=1 Tax=Amniculicola lignicola CBS 123094 TaxID=1392246 RepID=A0A6A5WRC6_9PLEO|nr:hypothetical protein P154DRAFT_531405 [Amniculicola lignicola CBS 123094]
MGVGSGWGREWRCDGGRPPEGEGGREGGRCARCERGASCARAAMQQRPAATSSDQQRPAAPGTSAAAAAAEGPGRGRCLPATGRESGQRASRGRRRKQRRQCECECNQRSAPAVTEATSRAEYPAIERPREQRRCPPVPPGQLVAHSTRTTGKQFPSITLTAREAGAVRRATRTRSTHPLTGTRAFTSLAQSRPPVASPARHRLGESTARAARSHLLLLLLLTLTLTLLLQGTASHDACERPGHALPAPAQRRTVMRSVVAHAANPAPPFHNLHHFARLVLEALADALPVDSWGLVPLQGLGRTPQPPGMVWPLWPLWPPPMCAAGLFTSTVDPVPFAGSPIIN